MRIEIAGEFEELVLAVMVAGEKGLTRLEKVGIVERALVAEAFGELLAIEYVHVVYLELVLFNIVADTVVVVVVLLLPAETFAQVQLAVFLLSIRQQTN